MSIGTKTQRTLLIGKTPDLYVEAIHRFEELLERAERTGLREPTAMALATANAAGWPSVRVVLLKQVNERGFVFYTNLKSRKGEQLAANPRAALCFYWDPLREQALVEGKIEPVSDEEADTYWARRPRQSQVGAWASLQSRPLNSRRTVVLRAAGIMAKYLGRPIPRPHHWSGFRVVPERIEFWKGRDHRLHDRFLYWKEEGRWHLTRLYP